MRFQESGAVLMATEEERESDGLRTEHKRHNNETMRAQSLAYMKAEYPTDVGLVWLL